MASDKIIISAKKKDKYIAEIKKELTTLRSKAGISQEELANVIGVSRQTYGAIERGTQKLTWNTYLSLILFYDYNKLTHDLLRSLSTFPFELLMLLNKHDSFGDIDISSIAGNESKNYLKYLDAQALHTIKTVIMLEYARCTNTPGEAVVRSFDGATINIKMIEDQKNAMAALKKYKEKN